MNVKKILITTDLSQYSLAALEAATEIGSQFGSKLYLLYVVDAVPSKHGSAPQEADPHAARRHAEDEGKKRLEEFIHHNVGAEVRLIPVVRMGSPVDEIRRFAETEGVDVVVIATHGWTGLRHILVGSVAERVVRLSSIPVLTVKPLPLRESILKDEDIESDLHLR